MTSRLRAILFGGVGSLFLVGCGRTPEHADRILLHGWASPTTTTIEKHNRFAAIYCYATLGVTECYATPEPGSALRLKGLAPALPVPETTHMHNKRL